MRLRDVLFPEGGKIRNLLRDSNKKIKTVIYGKVPEDSKETTYWKIMERLEPGPRELKEQSKKSFKIAPKISFIIITNRNKSNNKKALLTNIKKQTYKNFEILEKDELDIKEIVKFASGEYITFIYQEDLIARAYLYEFVNYINTNPKVQMIYTDEDSFEKNLRNRMQPIFKPDFSIDLLRGNNYIRNGVIYNKKILEKIEECKNEYDLLLRVTEITNQIGHIQKVLYHSRKLNEQEELVTTEKDIIKAHLNRIGLEAQVNQTTEKDIFDIQYNVKENPKVTILIPNKDQKETLKTCIEAITNKTTYSNYEIAIIENNSSTQEIFEYYKELEKNNRIKIIYYPEKEFNYSKIINYGAKNTDGEYIVQLNNDTELITNNWLEKMLGYCQRQDVGAVGARLYYSDMSLQHGGVVIGLGGVAGHRFLYLEKNEHAHYKLEMKISDVSCVTGACMMAKRETYKEVGYMNEDLAVAFNDVDFCLKIRKKGLLVVYNPFVELIHYESKTRGKENSPEKQERFKNEIESFMKIWDKTVVKGDPYYNKHLSIPEIEIEENRIQSTI